ncbi:membrane fusion protein, cobalt-zinc-cadmium efflux system [Gillisia sp. Hel1_33_143]|uniref:efflux RND transporter periplasmic adaptor subunit n=1 Tax=Gillisia sp. Hel1_33_143 TaxID=1336796 RepID=UPI00087B93BF|nr:efflux RND transporter periplasmic adaptor subunit [Gillisia sp. Hel1_33_143]SDR69973.1 membrane fusion protein, cobalt-zinc-cadmium efflux system [Gillisia sp. Hel1_33_143]
MKNIAIITTVLLTLLLIGCNDKSDSELGNNEESATSGTMENEESGHNEEEEGEEGAVELTKQQIETIGLETKTLEERNLGNNIKVTGMLELFPQDKANISPFVGGNVSSIKVVPGDNVRKGQVLAYIEHPDIIAMQQEYQEKNDELVFLKQDFERKQTLYDKGVSSGKEFQMAQSQYRSTTSSVNGLRSRLRLLGINSDKVAQGEIFSAIPITTPLSGYVGEVMVSLGDYVAPQSTMFSISDNSKIYVNFKVYEKDIKHIKEGQQIYFSTTSRPDALLKATVRSIGKTFESDPKAIEILADIENKDKNLLPGMYVEGRIVQGEKSGYAVPEEAIVKEGEQSYIFIVDEDEAPEENRMKFKRIPVSTGLNDLGFVEVNLPAEIAKNVKIVTSGAYTLSSEMVKGELEHGH